MTRGFQIQRTFRLRKNALPIKLGMSGGSLLLRRGGAGEGSSYDSPEQYREITGMGMGMSSALRNLEPKSIGRKVRNIRF
jgi:hypothetical protein